MTGYVKPKLTDSSAEIIKATLPVVGAHINEITKLFYATMFEDNPVLIRDLFNRANQARGNQQKALAGSIAAYATQLLSDDPADSPEEMLARIAHKHASLGIVRAQYDLVYKYLFGAIVKILGEAVTADVAKAWDELYWLMADDLVRIERDLYEAAGTQPGDVWRTVKVAGKEANGRGTFTFELASKDGTPLPRFVAGQYISVSVPLPDGAHQKRQYSLVSDERAPTWKISVRGAGQVSTRLHEHFNVGDDLEVSIPFGEFQVIDDSRDVALLGVGIGVTPVVGILHHLVATGSTRKVAVYIGDTNPARASHRAEIRSLVKELPGGSIGEWFAAGAGDQAGNNVHDGKFEVAGLGLNKDAHIYYSGPEAFLLSTSAILRAAGHSTSLLHVEHFGPTDILAS